MERSSNEEAVVSQRRDQILKLITKGFFNELINYGVRREEMVRVASHLLDNVLDQQGQPAGTWPVYNTLFSLDSVRDEWKTERRLTIGEVTLRPLEPALIPEVARWLRVPEVGEGFVPAFPPTVEGLQAYFARPEQDYFSVHYQGAPVGIVGGENVDPLLGKLEMKKMVGERDLQGRGIGKRATFAFLYYAFMILGLHKVYIHSRDINVRNLNLNSGFGFQLEGVFFEEFPAGEKRGDLIRMALLKPLWLAIFASPPERAEAPPR